MAYKLHMVFFRVDSENRLDIYIHVLSRKHFRDYNFWIFIIYGDVSVNMFHHRQAYDNS